MFSSFDTGSSTFHSIKLSRSSYNPHESLAHIGCYNRCTITVERYQCNPLLPCFSATPSQNWKTSNLLRISVFCGKWNFPVNWEAKRAYRDLQYPMLDASIKWTQ